MRARTYSFLRPVKEWGRFDGFVATREEGKMGNVAEKGLAAGYGVFGGEGVGTVSRFCRHSARWKWE